MKKYICDIMNAMPEEIDVLYFPIFVLPDRKMTCYKAQRNIDNISINTDEITIV